jgi:hypothetical protein
MVSTAGYAIIKEIKRVGMKYFISPRIKILAAFLVLVFVPGAAAAQKIISHPAFSK